MLRDFLLNYKDFGFNKDWIGFVWCGEVKFLICVGNNKLRGSYN